IVVITRPEPSEVLARMLPRWAGAEPHRAATAFGLRPPDSPDRVPEVGDGVAGHVGNLVSLTGSFVERAWNHKRIQCTTDAGDHCAENGNVGEVTSFAIPVVNDSVHGYEPHGDRSSRTSKMSSSSGSCSMMSRA